MRVNSYMETPPWAPILGTTHIVRNDDRRTLCDKELQPYNHCWPLDVELITCEGCQAEFVAIALKHAGEHYSLWKL